MIREELEARILECETMLAELDPTSKDYAIVAKNLETLYNVRTKEYEADIRWEEVQGQKEMKEKELNENLKEAKKNRAVKWVEAAIAGGGLVAGCVCLWLDRKMEYQDGVLPSSNGFKAVLNQGFKKIFK